MQIKKHGAAQSANRAARKTNRRNESYYNRQYASRRKRRISVADQAVKILIHLHSPFLAEEERGQGWLLLESLFINVNVSE